MNIKWEKPQFLFFFLILSMMIISYGLVVPYFLNSDIADLYLFLYILVILFSIVSTPMFIFQYLTQIFFRLKGIKIKDINLKLIGNIKENGYKINVSEIWGNKFLGGKYQAITFQSGIRIKFYEFTNSLLIELKSPYKTDDKKITHIKNIIEDSLKRIDIISDKSFFLGRQIKHIHLISYGLIISFIIFDASLLFMDIMIFFAGFNQEGVENWFFVYYPFVIFFVMMTIVGILLSYFTEENQRKSGIIIKDFSDLTRNTGYCINCDQFLKGRKEKNVCSNCGYHFK